MRLIQKPESLNRQGRRGYVVLNPEEAAKLWVPDVIIDKVIIANTIIIRSKILSYLKTLIVQATQIRAPKYIVEAASVRLYQDGTIKWVSTRSR